MHALIHLFPRSKMGRNIGQQKLDGFGCPNCMCPNQELGVTGQSWPIRNDALANRSAGHSYEITGPSGSGAYSPMELGLRPVKVGGSSNPLF
jgi:hypothetical protein